MARILWVNGITLGCLFMGFIGFAWYGMNAHPVRALKLEQVVEGMKSNQVERLLGKPTNVSKYDDKSQGWRYSSVLTWCMVTVEFSPKNEVIQPKNEVIQVVHDH